MEKGWNVEYWYPSGENVYLMYQLCGIWPLVKISTHSSTEPAPRPPRVDSATWTNVGDGWRRTHLPVTALSDGRQCVLTTLLSAVCFAVPIMFLKFHKSDCLGSRRGRGNFESAKKEVLGGQCMEIKTHWRRINTLLPRLMDDEINFYRYFRMTQNNFHLLLNTMKKH